MSRKSLVRLALLCLLALTIPAVARAQAPPAAQRGKAIVTVVDQSGGFIPGATVTIVGLENATKAAVVPPAKTDEKGIATFDRLVLGRYSIQGEFSGFQLGLLRDIRIKAGENKHLVILPLKQMSESVNVTQDQRLAASSRPSLGMALTREQIESLSDDPDEMQRQISELAGPNATIRVDSFEGSQLPPKAQIKSIHITRDQYAAENHYIGGLFIDIVTQPGVGPIRGNGSLGYNGSQLNSRTDPKYTPVKGPEQNRNYSFGFGGTIAKRKSDFSLNLFGTDNYRTPNLYAAVPSGIRAETLNLRVPVKQLSGSGTLNWAVTRDQTMRFSGNAGGFSQENQGVGAFNLPERAFSSQNRNYSFGVQEVGPIGRRLFLNTRARVFASTSESKSVVDAPTIIVNDNFTSGGAQRKGGTHSKSFSMQSDLDYIRGIHSWRTGIQMDGTWYRSDDSSNYLGTYTFTGIDAFNAGQPTFYTKRIGDPTISYSNFQGGVYLQDDIRVSKTLTLSPGIRYELQTHVTSHTQFGPRFGFTWSPFKNGKTTIRGGGGIFYDWLSTGIYAQTIRIDGFHQQDLQITNPTYPDPGNVGKVTTTNRYLLGSDYLPPRNTGITFGVDQSLTTRIRVSGGYSRQRSAGVLRGRNVNPLINGQRVDPRFLNVIETVSDAASRGQSAYVSSSFSLLAPSPTNNQKRWNWKRLSFSGSYNWSHDRNNSDGAFSIPASGTLDTEWGPSPFSRPQFVFFSLNSSQLKNVNINIGMNASSGAPYITTGFDNNGDLFFNDRPAGVSRNSARTPFWNRSMSGGFGYSWTFGKSAGAAAGGGLPPGAIQIISDGGGRVAVLNGGAPGAPAAGRYRMSLNVRFSNLTNRSNYSGYSGVMTSQLFGQPTSAGEPRRINLNLSFGF